MVSDNTLGTYQSILWQVLKHGGCLHAAGRWHHLFTAVAGEGAGMPPNIRHGGGKALVI